MTAYETLFREACSATRTGSRDMETLTWRAYYAACRSSVPAPSYAEPAPRRSLFSRLLRRG